MSPRLFMPCLAAFALLTLLSGVAVAGWMRHGETIFLRLAESMALTCP